MDIITYTKNLEELKNILPTEIDKILLSKQSVILTMLKFRLYNFGQDGNYDLIGNYSLRTKKEKKLNNQKSDFITLKDTGAFYTGMFLTSKNGEYKIDSTNYKSGLLKAEYGNSIMELTYKQQSDVIINIIEHELQKIIDDSLKDFNISL